LQCSSLEDAVADVRAKIIANISRVNPTPNGTFLGWCSVVAYRHGINYRARASTRYEFNVPGDEMSEFEDPVTIPPDESLQVRERRLALEKALALLHRKDRTCIVLRFRDGLSTREIASILLETEGAISNRIMRAKRKLKKLFLKYDV
jgi:RNA polymerase sigma factor (sigma-70 family)